MRPTVLSSRLLLVLLLAGPTGLAACQGATEPRDADAGSAGTAEAQIRRGGEVFAATCARCHGDSGGGTRKAPPLVGRGALPRRPREWQDRERTFRTALDVAGFAVESMPPDAEERSAIPAEDYWAVLAFALSANGVELDEPVGPGNAGEIVLNP